MAGPDRARSHYSSISACGAHDVGSNRRRSTAIAGGGRPNQYVGPDDQSHHGNAALDILRRRATDPGPPRDEGSGRGGVAAPAKLRVVDAIAPHEVQAHQEGPRHCDFGPGLSPAMKDALVEMLEIRIGAQGNLSRLAEDVLQQAIALFRDATQTVFPRRGRDSRGQPDVTHDMTARGEAINGPARTRLAARG